MKKIKKDSKPGNSIPVNPPKDENPFIVYHRDGRIYVTTKEKEADFLKQTKEWGIDLIPYDRQAMDSNSVVINPTLKFH